ncbi:hypothetical protein BS17DRAFT_520250 [Gyrodon lividus]|nr:hypothetical protein BS17DRAFT_520250 [Gyrodon lividus]
MNKMISGDHVSWITGYDGDAEIGCSVLLLMSPLDHLSTRYQRCSSSSEDRSLNINAREKTVHELAPPRTVHEDLRESLSARSSISTRWSRVKEVATLPLLVNQIEVGVQALGTEFNAALKSAVIFVGSVSSKGFFCPEC